MVVDTTKKSGKASVRAKAKETPEIIEVPQEPQQHLEETMENPLNGLIADAEKAYATYLEAQRQVATAYHETEAQAIKNYERAEQQAQNDYDEFIAVALRERDEAAAKAIKHHNDTMQRAKETLERPNKKLIKSARKKYRKDRVTAASN